MRLDHVSYACAPGELAEVVQRIGSELGAAFVDGGIHPSFGTRNFILPLANDVYVEVVAALDHPAAALSHPVALGLDEQRADTGIRCDEADRGGDLTTADLAGCIDAIHDHPLLADRHLDRTGDLEHRSVVARINPATQHSERHGAVHGAGVEIADPKSLSDRTTDRRLPGTRRTVDRDDRTAHQLVP